MNIKTPLASALLMLASTAMAQLLPYTAPAPGVGNYTDLTRPLSFSNSYSGPIPDDAAFNCSTVYNVHIPWRDCTNEQVIARLSFFGLCPFDNMACNGYMERLKLSSNFGDIQRQGTIDGPAAVKAAAAEKPIETASAAGAPPQPDDPGFIGPLLPPGFYDAKDKAALAEARKEINNNGVKDVIDLGDGGIAKMRDDGTVEMCSRSGCEKPVPASQVKNPKVELWVADNKMNDGSSGGGVPPKGPKASPGMNMTDNDKDTPGGSPPSSDTPSSPSDEAKKLGGEIPPNLTAMRGPDTSNDSKSASRGKDYAPAPDTKPIAVSQAEVAAQVAKEGYEFKRVENAAAASDAIIKGGAKALNTDVNANDQNLQYLGTQSGSNSK